MFNVGAIQATIELAGEALFTAAVKRSKAALEDVVGAASSAGAAIAKTEQAQEKAASATDRGTAANRKASTQAAVLDTNLDKVKSSANAAAGAEEKVGAAGKKAADGLDRAGDAAGESSAKQEAAAKAAARAQQKAAQEAEQALARQHDAMDQVGTAGLRMGTAVATGLAVAVYRASDFSAAMSEVQAASDASDAAMDGLRENALQLGADSSFSAKEAAQGQAELAKAGVSAAEIIGGGLKGSLDLAAAGNIGVAEAAETAATAMTQFRLSGEDVPHLADLLAAGANKAQGGVGDLSMALKQSGLVASQMGLSVEDTIGTLTSFASAGLLGSDAGTSFRTMLLAIANPTKESAGLMEDLGIKTYDAGGKFVGTAELAGQLTEAFKGKTDAERDSALATIFGSDAIRAANVLLLEGEDGIRKWIAATNDSGAAARTAATLQNNLAGDVEKLGGAFDGLLISSGSLADGPLRALVQQTTALLDLYANLPEGVQATVTVLGAAAGVVALVGGAALVAVPKIAAMKVALAELNTSGTGARGALRGVMSFLGGPWGIALAGATFLLGSFIDGQIKAQEQTNALRGSLDSQTAAFTDYSRDLIQANLAARDSFLWMEKQSGYDAAQQLGVDLDLVTDAAMGNAEAFKSLEDSYTAFLKTNPSMGDTDLAAWDLLYDKVSQQRDVTSAAREQQLQMVQSTKEVADAQESAGSATDDATESTAQTAEQMVAAGDTAQGYADKLSQLIETVMSYNELNQSAEQANIGLSQSYADLDQRVADAKAGVEGFGLGIQTTTQFGRDNRSALLEMAQASQDAAQKTLDAGGSQDQFRSSLENGRAKLIEYARQLGASASEANALADQIYKIPTERQFTAIANTSQAIQAAEALAVRLNSLPREKTIYVNSVIRETGAAPGAVKAAYDNAVGSVGLPGSHGGTVVRRYAMGGFENHTATLFPSGTTRVFNEPETGGELYAPLAQAKSARSRQILAAGASHFGDKYLGQDAYADLVARAAAPAPSAPRGPVAITLVNPHYRNLDEELKTAHDLYQE